MKLTEILEEICIGYNQNEPKSKKLRQYVKEVVDVLSAENAIYSGKRIKVMELNENWEYNLDGTTFLQGSYGTNTAIKHRLYDVDADIAFIIENDSIDLNLRNLIYEKLSAVFQTKYTVEMKKPCITIDFQDKNKIDVAIYTQIGDKLCFHNCISGVEKVDIAKPKELVNYFKTCYKENDTRRKVVRLIKHFIKTTSRALEIDECNKIPSISINLLLCEQKMHEQAGEEELYEDVLKGMRYIKQFVDINGYNGPSCAELCVNNTFYKVKNIDEVKKVLEKIIINLEHKQYNEIIHKDVYDAISARNSKKVDSSFTGTMG